MPQTKRTPAGEALSSLILDLFRLNSLLFTAGDRLVAGLGLTSARWQILGAIVAAERPQPVAWLARDLGAARQNVQRIVNDLERDGLVALRDQSASPPRPARGADRQGQQAFDAAMRLQLPWVNGLADGLVDQGHRNREPDRERAARPSWRAARNPTPARDANPPPFVMEATSSVGRATPGRDSADRQVARN